MATLLKIGREKKSPYYGLFYRTHVGTDNLWRSCTGLKTSQILFGRHRESFLKCLITFIAHYKTILGFCIFGGKVFKSNLGGNDASVNWWQSSAENLTNMSKH